MKFSEYLINPYDYPIGTEFAKCNQDGYWFMWYRLNTVKFNDGTEVISLQYLSACGGGWFGSSMTDDDIKNHPFRLIVKE